MGMPAWRWIVTLLGIFFGALLYGKCFAPPPSPLFVRASESQTEKAVSGLGMTIAADVQASVYETLGDIENPAWGRAFGLFNVKALMLSSIAIFEVGSAVCGAAPTSDALVVGRVIAGIGGSGMYLGALTYISIFATKKEIPLYNALIGLSWGVGAILGPVIGGAFSVSAATWRWAFYINLPLAALFAPVYFFVFPSFNPRKDISQVEKLQEIDCIGAVLNGAVFVLFIIVVTFSGSTFPWNSGSAIALWVVWGVCLVTYVLQQYFSILTTPDRRIFPLHFLGPPSLVLLYVTTAGAAAANGIALYYIPLFFQFTRGDTALQAAVRLLPLVIVFILSVMVAGASLPLTGRYSIFYVVGGALVIAGGALMFTVDVGTSTGKIYGFEVLLAAGTGLPFQTAYAVAASKVHERDRANAIGFINVAQIGTVAISLTIAGSLFQNLGFNSLKSAFAGYGFPDDYIRSALSGTVSPIFSSADPVVVALAVSSVADTIRRIFGAVTAGGAVLFVGGLLMPWEKLDLEAVAA
ncbi:major facilitator superfamily domain-containing protein [Ilyonectria robusta]|uniref:major facilitator superfamily domain-containing protein n=1 Tax=Ilyonectria robusta TaxID=1079257 RepID=UPI001E8E8FFA|nr:major facilitator superfamily domain-containing protein [Ilyonectria robusta]KAH8653283.1 major facilitator superfamily domain-containing protein [Ilyonectria robusta]